MSTQTVDPQLDDASKKKKRPDRPIYIPKIVKRDEPKQSSSGYSKTGSGPSPLALRRVSNASNAGSTDGSEHSKDTSSTIRSRERDRDRRNVDEDLPRANFYRHNANPGGSEAGHRDIRNARERTEQYRSFANRGQQRNRGGAFNPSNHRYSNQRRQFEDRGPRYDYRQHDDVRSVQGYERNRRVRNDSLMSEQPLPRPDSRNSPFDDTRSVCTDASFMENGDLANIDLRSQVSMSSMNSLIKPVLSIDSLLSQDMPNFDWTEDVDREEQLRASQMNLQQPWSDVGTSHYQPPTPSTPKREPQTPQTPQTPSTPRKDPQTPTTPRQEDEESWKNRPPSPLGTSIWSRITKVQPDSQSSDAQVSKEATPEAYDHRSKPPLPVEKGRRLDERVTYGQPSKGKWRKAEKDEERQQQRSGWQKPDERRRGDWQDSRQGSSRGGGNRDHQDRFSGQKMSENRETSSRSGGPGARYKTRNKFSIKSTPTCPRVDDNGLIIPPLQILKKEAKDPEKQKREIEQSKFLKAWESFQASKNSSQTSTEQTQRSGEITPVSKIVDHSRDKALLAQKLTGILGQSSSEAYNGKPESSPKKQAILVTKDESQRIKAFLKQLDQLCKEFTPRSKEELSEKIVQLSLKIGYFFKPIILRDLEYAHMTSMDQVLWRKNFYRAFETLKNATVGTGPNKDMILAKLGGFLEKLAEFYNSMLTECLSNLNMQVEDLLPFKSGFPEPTLDYCTEIGAKKHTELNQLNYICMGDISRYRVTIAALNNYRDALTYVFHIWSINFRFYAKAALLDSENGRAFNNIALIAVYSVIQRRPLRSRALSQRYQMIPEQNRWLDMIFFYARALSTVEPFESAKEALESAFSDMYKRCKHFDQIVSGIFDKLSEASSSSAAYRADRPHELWFLPDGTAKDVQMDEETCHGVEALSDEPIESNYKRMVVYLLHATGILVTKISAETFDYFAERALCHLGAVLRQPIDPGNDKLNITALELLKFAAIFIFTVHNSVVRGRRIGTQWMLPESFHMLLTYYGTLLRELKQGLEHLPKILSGDDKNVKILRLLPAIHFISHWLANDSVHQVYKELSLQCHSSVLFTVDAWKMLSDVSNTLLRLQNRHLLISLKDKMSGGMHTSDIFDVTRVVLPENVFISSFCDVFPAEPVEYFVDEQMIDLDLKNSSLLSAHTRLAATLQASQKLVTMDLPTFKWSDEKQKFYRAKVLESATNEVKEDSIEAQIASLKLGDDESAVPVKPKTREEEENLKQKLLMEEEKKKVVLEVHPRYLIVDTNTYVDHLEGIARILQSTDDFNIAIPTVVVSELDFQSSKLKNLPQIAGMTLDKEDWLAQKASEAMDWLRKNRDNKKFCTVTVKGDVLPKLMLVQEDLAISKTKDSGAKGRTNDDYILAACENMSKKHAVKPISKPSEAHPNQTFIAKSVVLITDDRALTIKALSSKVPVSTLPAFIEWAGLCAVPTSNLEE